MYFDMLVSDRKEVAMTPDEYRHSRQPKNPFCTVCTASRVNYENRKDKYGQVVRASCKCGLMTNWHTDHWIAKHCLGELHRDPLKGARLK
jgi:hypothetical protein